MIASFFCNFLAEIGKGFCRFCYSFYIRMTHVKIVPIVCTTKMDDLERRLWYDGSKISAQCASSKRGTS